MTVKLYDRAGMNATTIGTGTTVALGSALGAVAPNVCSFVDFNTAGAANGDTLRILILDNNGNWEISTFTYNTAGPTLTGRTVEDSSNGGAAISLTGSEQVFIMAGAADIVTNFAGRSPTAGAITPTSGDYSISANTIALPQSYLAGMQLSNDGTTPNSVLDITAGQARDSTNATNIVLGAFTKSIAGSWVAGSGANGMGAGLTIAASTWYHVFAAVISGSADVFFDTSVTAANAPAGTTAFRRIGSFKTDGSGHIIKFTQNGDEFLWSTPVQDVTDNTTLGTTSTNFTVSVPTGFPVAALLHGTFTNTVAAQNFLLYSPLTGTQAAGSPTINRTIDNVTAAVFSDFEQTVRTNTSAQVAAVSSAASGNTFYLLTKGWVDRRGKDT